MQIIAEHVKPLRYDLRVIQPGGSQAAVVLRPKVRALVSTDNTMDADGNGVFDAYIVGDGTTPNSGLTLHYLVPVDTRPAKDSEKAVTSGGVYNAIFGTFTNR